MDDSEYYRRQGFWLRMARERSGKSQSGAAQEIGLSASSKSTISDYETGEQVAPQPVIRKLARWYGVPVELFLHPPLTADDVIQKWIDEASHRGASAEQSDWEEEGASAPVVGDVPDDERGIRSA